MSGHGDPKAALITGITVKPGDTAVASDMATAKKNRLLGESGYEVNHAREQKTKIYRKLKRSTSPPIR